MNRRSQARFPQGLKPMWFMALTPRDGWPALLRRSRFSIRNREDTCSAGRLRQFNGLGRPPFSKSVNNPGMP